MQVIKDEASLAGAIRILESRKVLQHDDIRIHWEKAKETLTPSALLKDGLRETFTSPDFKESVIKGAVSIATGVLTKKLFIGSSHNVVTKLLGTLLQTGAAGLTYKNTDVIKHKGASFLSDLLKKIRIN